MPSDREAFVAGIAADPDNDLRRLVFADWLEENGEAERAEFIRLQIEAAGTHVGQLPPEHLTNRTLELFRAHSAEWFGPFFAALDTDSSLSDYEAFPYGRGADFRLRWDRRGFVSRAGVHRGFVGTLHLQPSLLPARCALADAFAREPVTHLTADLTATPREWTRFSDPVLRHVRWLCLLWQGSGPLASAHEAFADAHLPAVRELFLNSFADDGDGCHPLPPATVQAFANSALAYRLTLLDTILDDAGLRALSRSSALRLETFSVTGNFTADGLRPLATAGFAPTLRNLWLTGVDTAAVSALVKGTKFARLNHLDLRLREPPDAAFRLLASARFLPQLEYLELFGNERAGSVEGDTPAVRELADALDPDRLKSLDLRGCGFADPPPCLVAKFGDRVSVG